MGKYCLMVISSPIAGKDIEYNLWYKDHLKDVSRIPGIVSAQRLRMPENEALFSGKYVALYQVETDDPDRFMKDLASRAGTPEMVMSDALDLDNTWHALCPVIE